MPRSQLTRLIQLLNHRTAMNLETLSPVPMFNPSFCLIRRIASQLTKEKAFLFLSETGPHRNGYSSSGSQGRVFKLGLRERVSNDLVSSWRRDYNKSIIKMETIEILLDKKNERRDHHPDMYLVYPYWATAKYIESKQASFPCQQLLRL